MKKSKFKLIAALLLAGALLGFAQNINDAVTVLVETIGETTYIGKAQSTRNGGAPSTSNAVWKITRITDDGTDTTVTHAYNSNFVSQVDHNVWTNRAAATYK